MAQQDPKPTLEFLADEDFRTIKALQAAQEFLAPILNAIQAADGLLGRYLNVKHGFEPGRDQIDVEKARMILAPRATAEPAGVSVPGVEPVWKLPEDSVPTRPQLTLVPSSAEEAAPEVFTPEEMPSPVS